MAPLVVARGRGRHCHLASEACAALKQDHFVAALRSDLGRLQSARSASDDDHAPGTLGARERRSAEVGLAARGRVVHAAIRPLAQQAPDALLVAGHTRPDVLDAAFEGLVCPVGIRNELPRHADELRLAVREHLLCVRRRAKAAECHHGQVATVSPSAATESSKIPSLVPIGGII